jgi:LysM repeat protein
MPEITLSLPAALGLLALFILIGAVLVFFALRQSSGTATALEPTPSPSPTLTVTPTNSPTPVTPTPTYTPQPTPTALSYTVKLGDTCGGIAFAFKVSIQSIVLENNLPADCSSLFEGQQLNIPQPTATATALPTATLSPAEATEAACQKDTYTVQSNDTLGSISGNYNVPIDAIKQYNGLVSDVVVFGQRLIIPLCRRNQPAGNTPTPTVPPPYPAPNPLLPADGAPFALTDDVVTLQWASVGALRENESYAITLEDITAGQGKSVVYVNDTKYLVPSTYRPTDGKPHVIRWFVVVVRQVGTDDNGNPIWELAGAGSPTRVFSWSGVASSTPGP